MLVIVTDGEHTILVFQYHSSKIPYWKIPGGHINKGENMFKAGARELQEETGMHIRPRELRLLKTVHHPHHRQYVVGTTVSRDRLQGIARRGVTGEKPGIFRLDELVDMMDLLPPHRSILKSFAPKP